MKKGKLLSALLYLFSMQMMFATEPDNAVKAVDREQQQLEWCFTFSNMMGYNISYINNPRIYKVSGEWLGVPYKYSGKSRNGIDCSGLVCELYRGCYNIPLSGSAQDLYRSSVPVLRKELREGDLVFFKIKKNKVSHVGIFLGQNKFIHATLQRGVIISDLNEAYYSKYYFSGGRMKK
jgi:lipoprotein Spr